jgi:hypothetical protein
MLSFHFRGGVGVAEDLSQACLRLAGVGRMLPCFVWGKSAAFVLLLGNKAFRSRLRTLVNLVDMLDILECSCQ